MKITGTYYLYPEDKSKVSEIYRDIEVAFPSLFSEKNFHVSTKEVEIMEEGVALIKKFCKEKRCHMLTSWFSDDISQYGFDFFYFDKPGEVTAASGFEGMDMLMTDFLILCGMKELIEREIV